MPESFSITQSAFLLFVLAVLVLTSFIILAVFQHLLHRNQSMARRVIVVFFREAKETKWGSDLVALLTCFIGLLVTAPILMSYQGPSVWGLLLFFVFLFSTISVQFYWIPFFSSNRIWNAFKQALKLQPKILFSQLASAITLPIVRSYNLRGATLDESVWYQEKKQALKTLLNDLGFHVKDDVDFEKPIAIADVHDFVFFVCMFAYLFSFFLKDVVAIEPMSRFVLGTIYSVSLCVRNLGMSTALFEKEAIENKRP